MNMREGDRDQDGSNRLAEMPHRREEGAVGRQRQMERLGCQVTHTMWRPHGEKGYGISDNIIFYTYSLLFIL
jgi:hypothetical protein